jgi:hypothetical protein
VKRYTNGEITVVWQPHLCIGGICDVPGNVVQVLKEGSQ